MVTVLEAPVSRLFTVTFARTTAAIDRWDEWLPAWTATAEIHLALAEEARARGAERSAGEAYLRAAVSYHFSKFVWVVDPERNRRNTEAAVGAVVFRSRSTFTKDSFGFKSGELDTVGTKQREFFLPWP